MYHSEYIEGCDLAISKFPEFEASGSQSSVHGFELDELAEDPTLLTRIANEIKKEKSEFVAGGC